VSLLAYGCGLPEARGGLVARVRSGQASPPTMASVVDTSQVGLTMGYKFCTIRFKDRIGLGSGSISSHF
jgi:hypothetical protein